MINLLFLTQLILTCGYLLAILLLIIGILRIKPGNSDRRPSVSIVIAARNEADNIENCLKSLVLQTYPAGKLEFFIVDDRSTDATAQIVADYLPHVPNLHLVRISQIPDQMAPKKYALSRGIAASQGELIFTTDADCQPVPTWVETLVRSFSPETGLVAGYSPLEIPGTHSRRMHRMFALESLSLACVAAGGIGLGQPLTCSGRNLAYRRQVFDAVGGFSKIAQYISGDDDLFLQQVSRETHWKIGYALDARALVYSAPPKNFKAFFQQRTRHASKGKFYRPQTVAGLVAVYLFNLLTLAGILFGWALPTWFWLSLGGFAAKSLFELALLFIGAHFFQKNYLLRIFPLVAVLHLPYVVIFGALGTFKQFQWKDQHFTARG